MIKKLSILVGVFALLLMTGVVSAQEATTRGERAEVRFLAGMIDHHQMAVDMASHCLAKAVTESVQTLCQNIIAVQSREVLTMRGWLLAWYAVDYEPASMPHAAHEGEAASGGMMQGDMMGMMQGMSDMMAHMSSMMGMMGMMGGGDHEAHHPESTAQAPEAHGGAGGAAAGNHGDHSTSGATGALTHTPMMMGMMAGLSQLTGTDYEIAWLEAMIDHHDDAIHMAERLLPQVVHAELGELAQQIIDDQTAEIEAMEALISELSP